MTIRLFIVTVLSVITLQDIVNAQSQQYADAGQLPKIVPPSPEVASIANVAQVSNGMFTGAANASVPLYTIKHGNIAHPIELRYSTNGLKVAEMPSSVGLGWNLMAGGSISRVVHDEPDGESDYLTPPADFGTYDLTLLNYVSNASLNNKDTEFDEYSISAGGLSGKFYIDATGAARFTSHSNLKVTATNPGSGSSVFLITATDGSKYYFGELQNAVNVVEKTTEIRANSKDTKYKVMTTTWFLTRIVSAQGDVIQFNYTAKAIQTKQGAFQQVVLNNQNYSPGPLECNLCTAPPIPTVDYNRIHYNSYYLSSITAGHVTASFTYENRGDQTNDKRLTGLLVNYNSGGGGPAYQVKNYSFEYEDLNTIGFSKKYYLKKVRQLSLLGITPSLEPLTYEFQYNSGDLPHVDALTQDYMGYYNGKGGTNFFPRPSNYGQYINGSQGIDRSPDFSYAQRGALKKMIYPTGGYEEFEYEPHILPEEQTNTTYTNAIVNTPGTGWNSPQVVTTTVNPSSTHTANLTIVTRLNPGGPQDENDPGYNPPDNIWDIAKVEVIKTNGTTQTIFSATIRNWETSQYPVSLVSGNSYQLKLTVWGLTNDANATLQYNPVTITETVNVEACGIRVKKINSFEPVTNQTLSRYYKYTSLADQNLSSGVGTKTGSPFGFTYLGGWCGDEGMGQALVECDGTLQISSTSLTSIYMFSGSPVAYKYVLESNDPGFVNGVTEHEYHAAYIGSQGANMLNHLITNAPTTIAPDMNGLEKKTVVYKKQGSSFIKQQEIQNNYSWDSRINQFRTSNVVRKRWDHPGGSESYTDKLKGYDVTQYYLISGWAHLDKTITTTYDPDGLNPQIQEVDYTYGNEQHMQPTLVATQDSKSGALVTESKFPVDYPSTAPYTDMLSRNMQTAVVETNIKRNATEQVRIKNNFYKWYDNGTDVVIAGASVQSRTGSNSLENKIVYESYDNNGNLLQATGRDGVTTAFIWGYNKQYPVAKIINKSYANAVSQSSIDLIVVNNPASVAALRTELNKLYTLSDAFVTTYIYKPFIGVIQETDQRNRVVYYEYDGFNRLSVIKDHDLNVIKKLCYNYAGQAENCLSCDGTNSSANWQNTATPPTCVQGSCGNTGYQLQEQRDMNPCSPTYNQTRQVSIYNPTACVPQTGVTVSFVNSTGLTGYTAVYTQNGTGLTYTFSIPGTGTGTLGCIPSGKYSLTISKTPSGTTPLLLFGSGCQYISGTWSATFSLNTNFGCGYNLSIEWDEN